jgi:outer membrane protein assembly factor BamD (BamD/ComL family)
MNRFKLLLTAQLTLLLCSTSLFSLDMTQVRDTYVSGVQALANGQLLEAESAFKTIIALPLTAPYADEVKRYQARAYYFLGDVYFMKRSYEQAISYYRIVLQKYQDSDIYPRTLYKLGRTYILQEEYTDGIGLRKSYLSRYDTDAALAARPLLARQGILRMIDYRWRSVL